MLSQSYPLGTTYSYTYDSMGRPTKMTDTQLSQDLVSSVTYGPAGELLDMTGTSVNEHRTYNSNGQVTRISNPGVMDLNYVYPASTNNGQIASQYDALSGETVSYQYDSLKRLASAAAPTNLAAGKSATQSSNLPGYPLANVQASNAVDGKTDGNYNDASITHTDSQANAWWQVDLGSSQAIGSITIWNRTDCCADRLSDYWVFVSDTPYLSTDTPATLSGRAGTWSSHQTVQPNPSVSIPANVSGRYVRVQLSGTNYLSLAEVQVMSAGSSAWNQNFGYDGFGNLTSKTGSGIAPVGSYPADPATNRLQGYTYDANGNQLFANSNTLIYDVSNRMIASSGASLQGFMIMTRGTSGCISSGSTSMGVCM